MTAFVTYLVLRRPFKALAGRFARLRAALDDPFALLHKINWSAPWLERKFCVHCDD